MTFAGLLEDTVRRLNRIGIPYMVTGSVASSYYGEPRATRDLDIVIDPDARTLDLLVEDLLDDGLYVDREAAREARMLRTQFNVIGADALKIDFVIRHASPFSVEEFERRQPVDLLGTPAFIPTVEDMILAKLKWASDTASERQLRDVAGMLALSGDNIDYAYLNKWISALDLASLWEQARNN